MEKRIELERRGKKPNEVSPGRAWHCSWQYQRPKDFVYNHDVKFDSDSSCEGKAGGAAAPGLGAAARDPGEGFGVGKGALEGAPAFR